MKSHPNKLLKWSDKQEMKFRLSFKVESNGCWMWEAGFGVGGYGAFRLNGITARAHRVSYVNLVGLIPEGLVLDHLCRNRGCVNPDHLEAVTQAENSLRGIGFAAVNQKKTHCIHGHEFTKENTQWRNHHKGKYRQCRTCNLGMKTKYNWKIRTPRSDRAK